jgi:hypothetical protein
LVGSYYPLAVATVPSGGVATISFQGIPSGYRHLQVRYMARSGRARTETGGVAMRVNNAYFDYGHEILASGSAVTSSAGVTSIGSLVLVASGTNATAGIFGSGYIDILNYADTNKNKTFRALSGVNTNGAGQIKQFSGLFASTSAVTSITFESVDGGTNLQEFSTFALYGVK